MLFEVKNVLAVVIVIDVVVVDYWVLVPRVVG